jgi:YVTN family beta-propeller protein
MKFCVLGPLEAVEDGRSAAVGGGRERALLALLLVHAGEIVSRDRMIEELWHGEPPSSGPQSLDVYISRLRKAFRDVGAEDVVTTRAPGYLLNAFEVDSRLFEQLAADGRDALTAGDADRAAQVLRNALALWRGAAYVEVADELWARAEADRLEELRLTATEDRIDADLSLGRHSALVPELEVLTTKHPTRERLVCQRMLALYRSGRQADALAAYRDARRSLVDELGLEPGPELRRLESAVLAQDESLDLPPAEPSKSRPPAPRSKRRVRAALTAGGLAVAAAVVAFIAIAGGTDRAGSLLTANAAGGIDPVSGHVAANVPLGFTPTGITSGAGHIWVSNSAEGTVTRIDPRGHADQTIAVGSSPVGVTAGAGAIWAANALDASVSRIDPRAREVVQTIRVGRRPIALTVGGGTVWVADSDGDAVIPLNARDGVPQRPVRLDASPRGVAFGFDSVWVTEPAAHRLVRLNPQSRAAEAEVAVGAGAGQVAVGGGAVWVVNTLDGTLSRIDPRRNAVTSTVSVGDAPTGVAASRQTIWVTDEGRGEVISVDPRTGAVRRRFKVGGAPRAVALLGRAPWVASGLLAGRAHRGGTLRISYTRIAKLDPAIPFDVHPGIWHALGDGLLALVQSQGAAELVPDLATNVPRPTDGGLTYAFKLRPRLRYSTGGSVRSSDFRRQLERVYRVGSDMGGFYANVRGAALCARRPPACDLSKGVLTDDRTGSLVFRLVRPDPDFLFKLTFSSAWPVPVGTPRDHSARSPIPGTGPYRVAHFDPGKQLVLARNEHFREWSRAAQPDGYADRIEIQMDDDPQARADAVLRGKVDMALEIQSARVHELRFQHASQLRRHAQPETLFYAFNVRHQPFNDVRARQAVNLAIDRTAFARHLGGRGLATTTCQILPGRFPAHEDYCPWSRPPHDGRWHGADLARARALVRASGTGGARVRVITEGSNVPSGAATVVLATALRRLGYRPTLVVAHGTVNRGWELADGDWVADYPSPGQFLDYFLSCANYHPGKPTRSTNGGGFCDPVFDRLVARAQALEPADPQRAQTIWARADRRAVDEAAWLPMASTAGVELLSRRVGHFTLNAMSQPGIDQLWVR